MLQDTGHLTAMTAMDTIQDIRTSQATVLYSHMTITEELQSLRIMMEAQSLTMTNMAELYL